MRKVKLVLNRKTIYLIIMVSLVAIAGLNSISWLFLQNVKADLLGELKNQILHLGQICTRLINGNDMEKITVGSENSPLVIYYQQLLYDLKINNNLENIIILDPAGQLLIDYRLHFAVGDTLFAFPLYRKSFRAATLGEIPDPILSKMEDQFFLSAYLPVTDDWGETVAVLTIDAPMNFFDTLHKYERGVLYLGASGLAILLLFSLITLLATRRLFYTESQMKEQERLVELGQMAASVAHEIRNPLSIIKGTAEVLQKKYSGSGDEMFTFIPEEIDRLNRLVEDFLQFARSRKLKYRRHSAVEIVKEAVNQMRDNRLKIKIGENIPKINTDKDALRQVILNLLQNARDAIEKNGSVTISVEWEKSRTKHLIVEIEDTGKGIPEKEINKVFDPFFSTKSSGSGLGLAISKQLVEQMDGTITLSSKPGLGTKVKISLSI